MSEKLQKLLTFNEDNKDIYELLNKKSNASQYTCEAVRFYERHKDFIPSVSTIEIKIDKMLKQLEKGIVQIESSSNVDIDLDLIQQIMDEDD
jgi:hypothetical protein